MIALITMTIVGAICIFLGIQNRKGNIESLHSYHRQRVTEEDRLPFGKQVGLGMIIIGIVVIIMGILLLLTELTKSELYALIGSAVLVVGIAAGTGISFHAMCKYNKGIF